jgi:hypothetical protein
MDDDVIGDLTTEHLAKAGFVTGNAVKFLKAFAVSSFASPASSGSGAVTSHFPSLPPLASDEPRSLESSNFKREHARAASWFHQDRVPDDMTDQ